MRFVVCHPSVNNFAASIADRQRSTRQQIACNVRFVDIQYRCVLHNDGGIVEFFPIIVGFHIYLIDLLCTVLHQLEHDAFGFGIAIRGTFFRQRVLFFQFQPAHGVRHFAGGPALYQIAVCIADFQLCAGQFLAVSDILLGYVHTGAQVGVCTIYDLPCNLLTFIGELYIHRGAVQQIPGRSFDLDNAVSAAVAGIRISFCADGNVHIKPSKATFVGGAAFCQFRTGVQQLRTVCGINVIHGVEFIHRTAQISHSLPILLVNAYTDFTDFIAGLFRNRQHTRIFKHECLPVLVGI